MENKNYDNFPEDGIRFIGSDFTCDGQKKYFCKAFVVTCPCFENTGLCNIEGCVHAEPNIPSSDEMLRLQLIAIRRTQYDMNEFKLMPHCKPKTR